MVASGTLIAANTGYLVALVVGGGVAVLTFQHAIETLVSLLPLFARVDPARFDIIGLLAMVAFFVAYGIATHSLDRLVIGAIHALSAD